MKNFALTACAVCGAATLMALGGCGEVKGLFKDIAKAVSTVSGLDDAIKTYAAAHNGELPGELKDLTRGDNPLVKGGERALIDPWGNAYILKKEASGKYYVFSCGPDGIEGSRDDIRSDDESSSSTSERPTTTSARTTVTQEDLAKSMKELKDSMKELSDVKDSLKEADDAVKDAMKEFDEGYKNALKNS